MTMLYVHTTSIPTPANAHVNRLHAAFFADLCVANVFPQACEGLYICSRFMRGTVSVV
jgi:hypothetical protein